MSKWVDASNKTLYAWVHLQMISTKCRMKEQETSIANLFIVQLQFYLE